MKGLQLQVDKLQGLLAAKRAYDEAIVSINKCLDAGALTPGEAEAQRAEADAALNAAKEASGVAATRTDIDTQEGEEKENPAGEKSKKSKRGRPAGSKNASKTRMDDLSDATLAAVCSDLDLAPAVGSESSVREQRMRGIHTASGSTAKLPKTSLDRLSVATLKFICTDRKLPTSGEDMDRQIYIDRILTGLPGKKRSSQLEKKNVGGHTASVDLKVEGGGGGQEAAMSSCSIDKARDQMPLKDMSAGKQPEKNNITAADDTLLEEKSEESQKRKQRSVGQTTKAPTTMQATATEQTTGLAANAFTAVLAAVPADSWSRTWPAERTMMLRMSSKSVRDIVDKLRPPAFVRWRMSFLDDRLNGTGTERKHFVFRQLTALTAVCHITTLELFFDDSLTEGKQRRIQKRNWTSHLCRVRGHDVERLAGVLAECPALTHLNLRYNAIGECRVLAYHQLQDGRLAKVLGQCRVLSYLNLSWNKIGAAGAGKLAGVLGQCRALAHLDLSWNWIGDAGAESLAGVLAQCAALAHLNLSDNGIGDDGAVRLAGVLAQCPALTHLNLKSHYIRFGDDGEERLTAAWRGERRNLVLE
jgi:hypothetical protein